MSRRRFFVVLVAVLFVEGVLVALYRRHGGVSLNAPGILCCVVGGVLGVSAVKATTVDYRYRVVLFLVLLFLTFLALLAGYAAITDW